MRGSILTLQRQVDHRTLVCGEAFLIAAAIISRCFESSWFMYIDLICTSNGRHPFQRVPEGKTAVLWNQLQHDHYRRPDRRAADDDHHR